eukprot:7132367-Pyramimonas_sp.AAC.2
MEGLVNGPAQGFHTVYHLATEGAPDAQTRGKYNMIHPGADHGCWFLDSGWWSTGTPPVRKLCRCIV